MEQLLDLVRQYLPEQTLIAVLTTVFGVLMTFRGVRQLFDSWSNHRLTMREMQLKETLCKDSEMAPHVPHIIAAELGDCWYNPGPQT